MSAQDPRLEGTAEAIHSATCEDSWTECTEDQAGQCWKAARAALEAITKMTTLHPATLLGRILAFAQTFEAVPAEEYISSGDTEAAYDRGYAVGHNDALTALNNFLNGVRP